MRASKLYAPTLREVPADAEVISHKLMLRAGMIRKAAGGFYSYLPLAWRTLKKIETIVREEMDNSDAQELLMPIMQPAEIWQETGRWDVYGDEMFRLTDRHDRKFCLGPTHEEMITTLVRSDLKSYRQLPLNLYQIQNKFRDERRPRFGLMRGREFIMTDAYSFDKDEEGLDQTYQNMYDAYTRIFQRCGLDFRAVEADGGAIGGSSTHEFMVMAESGEAAIVYCEQCDYAANVEKAELKVLDGLAEEMQALTLVDTPNQKTIAEVTDFLKIKADKLIKAVAYQTEKGLVLALIRGDHEANDVKIQNIVDCMNIEMASEELLGANNLISGYLGPIGLENVIIIADNTVMKMFNAVCGGNQVGKHFINVNPSRDFPKLLQGDIRLIQQGDPCPKCTAKLETARGIEVGQVFKLHTKYSEALKATYLDFNGKAKPMVMGCYGIGVSRTMAATIEQNYDENGIIWPVSIAPYEVVIVPINTKDAEQMQISEQLYETLAKAGVEVVLDDRNERAGVKFKDADLIGYPVKITIGPKAVSEDTIEIKSRKDGEIINSQLENCAVAVETLLKKLSK